MRGERALMMNSHQLEGLDEVMRAPVETFAQTNNREDN